MNLSELQSIQSAERQADSLQALRSSFYEDAGEFIAELRAERAAAVERTDDPFADAEVRRLTDDIETARSTVEAIYERRIGKVVKMASLAAADMPTEAEGLTAEETTLFDELVAAIRENRREVMAVVDEDAVPGEGDVPETIPDVVADEGVGAAELMGDDEADAGGAEADRSAAGGPSDGGAQAVPPDAAPPEEAPPPADPDAPDDEDEVTDDPVESSGEATDEATGAVPRTTVRITRDVGEIFGVDDRAYDLSADDVVTLPEANAEPLVADDAAEPLE